MDKIFKVFSWWFKLTWTVQQKTMNRQKGKEKSKICFKIELGLFIVAVLLLIISALCSIEWMLLVVTALLFLWCTIDFVSNAYHIFTSVRGFLGRGISFIFLLFSCITAIAYTALATLQVSGWIVYGAICAILGLLWAVYSSFANTRVSVLVNAILTTAWGVLTQTINNAIQLLPESRLLLINGVQELQQFGYSASQAIGASISLVGWPIFFSLALATIVCAVKKYWVEKYNEGHEID